MALSCGIIGLPMTGKTTFFNLLTGEEAETSDFFTGKTSTNTGHAVIPDERVDYLSAMFKPKKTTYASVEVIDVPGLVRGSSQGQGSGNEFLASVRNTDLLAHIVRAFANDEILHAEESIDIMRDIATVSYTHLDVYKRQGLSQPVRKLFYRTADYQWRFQPWQSRVGDLD